MIGCVDRRDTTGTSVRVPSSLSGQIREHARIRRDGQASDATQPLPASVDMQRAERGRAALVHTNHQIKDDLSGRTNRLLWGAICLVPSPQTHSLLARAGPGDHSFAHRGRQATLVQRLFPLEGMPTYLAEKLQRLGYLLCWRFLG